MEKKPGGATTPTSDDTATGLAGCVQGGGEVPQGPSEGPERSVPSVAFRASELGQKVVDLTVAAALFGNAQRAEPRNRDAEAFAREDINRLQADVERLAAVEKHAARIEGMEAARDFFGPGMIRTSLDVLIEKERAKEVGNG